MASCKIVTVFLSPETLPLFVEIGVHQSLVQNEAILVGFLQSIPSNVKRSILVVCFKVMDKVDSIVIQSNAVNFISEILIGFMGYSNYFSYRVVDIHVVQMTQVTVLAGLQQLIGQSSNSVRGYIQNLISDT